jgi:hypothetical protein
METFAPGDRVVAINTDISAPIYSTIMQPAYVLPDGPLRENTIYHVEGVKYTSDGHQGVFITGLRVLVGINSSLGAAAVSAKWISHAIA